MFSDLLSAAMTPTTTKEKKREEAEEEILTNFGKGFWKKEKGLGRRLSRPKTPNLISN